MLVGEVGGEPEVLSDVVELPAVLVEARGAAARTPTGARCTTAASQPSW